MNDTQIVNLVSKWQTRLKLDHWDVEVEVTTEKVIGSGIGGNCGFDFKYLNADIKITKTKIDGTEVSKEELASSIVH